MITNATIPGYSEDAGVYLDRLEQYKDAVVSHFPEFPRYILDNWTLLPVDALVLGYFLRHQPREVTVLEIGTFIGISAHFFASHPRVSRVISIDPDPVVADELTANSGTWRNSVELESLRNVSVLDVARASLEDFEESQKKIELRQGVVGTNKIGVLREPSEETQRVEVPALDSSQDTEMVAFVDGLHTRDGVRADLEAIFEQNPYAIAFLDDCRNRWGPYVQAGVVDFIEYWEGYEFKLIGDLGPGLAKSSLGLVFPTAKADETRMVLEDLGSEFSARLDPVRLLEREEELIAIVNRTMQERDQARKKRDELQSKLTETNKKSSKAKDSEYRERVSKLEQHNADLQQQVTRLQQRNAHLTNHYASRRYKLADFVMESLPALSRRKS